MKIILETEGQTQKLAKEFSNIIVLPLIIGFKGDLGVGKTVFIRNLIKCFKEDEAVKSPTFSLVEEYEYENAKIAHIDLYRITNDEEYYLDYQDYQANNSLILIEWIQNDLKLMSNSDIIIEINIPKEKNNREISFEGQSNIGKKILKNL
jgi:tRNA threonylcarbamoyladenosine biosynthesis protein TsaE|tara:strand:+ start:28 stop:477 length:450 start_codon:yes stop_codon:yes gene_type:complete